MNELTTAPACSADINEHNAQQLLIEASQQRLVLAFFWAAANPPSQQMLPVLEKLASEYNGDFLLARVDVATQGMIARQLGVQSLPTTMLIRDGRPLDGFAGAASDSEIRALLDKYLPKPWDKQLEVAQPLLAAQAFAEALPLLRQAYADSSQRPDIGLHLAHAYIGLNRLDEADALLQATPMVAQDALYQQLLSLLHLKRTAAKTPEVEILEKALADNPDDLSLKMQLAVQYQQEQQSRQALELLLSILKVDKHYGDARKTMLDIFKSLGNNDPLVTEFQRQLFSLLY